MAICTFVPNSIKSALIGIAVFSLIFLAVSSSVKYWQISEPKRKAAIGDTVSLRIVVPRSPELERPSFQNELQGGVYRILCLTQYASLRTHAAHQIELQFLIKNELFEVSFVGSVGPAGRENNKALQAFLNDTHSFLKKAIKEATTRPAEFCPVEPDLRSCQSQALLDERDPKRPGCPLFVKFACAQYWTTRPRSQKWGSHFRCYERDGEIPIFYDNPLFKAGIRK